MAAKAEPTPEGVEKEEENAERKTPEGAASSGKKRKGSKEKKKKGSSKSSSKSKKKGSKGSKKKGKKGKKKGKKKRGSASSQVSDALTSENVTDSKPKYTDEDVKEYLRRKEVKKKKLREKRLVARMKEIISVVRTNDPRWNAWTEAPLYEFIRNTHVPVLTIFFKKNS